jgi:hypothetical protein
MPALNPAWGLFISESQTENPPELSGGIPSTAQCNDIRLIPVTYPN